MDRKTPWRRKWQPTPVFLPGNFHGQRSLVGYSPWGHKESDTTEQFHFHFHFEPSLALPFFGIGMKTDLFQSCSHCCSVQLLSHGRLCDPIDYNPPGSSVHGISQAKILEWDAISFSRGSSQPRDRTWVSCITDRRFYRLSLCSESEVSVVSNSLRPRGL